ncbi:MAG: DUF87 domain-containing protein [Deltaproteobacteria bacterium]|nr:DUF87 domain-containing protein [Candidatus Zymogenaceae bacterium]
MASSGFYLGKIFDEKKGALTDQQVLYDSRDLTTHGVIIGMTGSGKTGLSVGLIEEAALNGIPVVIIDPKAEMTNLLLAFPELSAEKFEPWVDPGEAERKGKTVAEYAADTAALWKKGLSEWGIGPDRIKQYRDGSDFVVYTPGSTAALPINVISSFQVPSGVEPGSEDFLELISGSVTALLALVGVEADPITSREHILLAKIWEDSWMRGQDLNLEKIITFIMDPPLKRVGVFELESFYPRDDRMKLAVMLNNIIASPSFAPWREGPPLSVESLVSPNGKKPGVSIFYISHLSEAERQFFISMLLWRIVSWMRGQEGTSKLRMLIYIDEAVGLLPPYPKDPPSKKPILTLLKQARAYGIGMLMATQNPVDLDYKALTNAGTWFIGRLQTKQDKERLLEGLQYVSEGGPTKKELGDVISSLESRQFILHNIHEDSLVTFTTRWVMSYLRGPISKNSLANLPVDTVKAAPAPKEKSAKDEKEEAGTLLRTPAETGEKNLYLSLKSDAYPYLARFASAEDTKGTEGMTFLPGIVAVADTSFDITKKTTSHSRTMTRVLFPLTDETMRWDDSVPVPGEPTFETTSPIQETQAAGYRPIPHWCMEKGALKKLSGEFVDYLYATSKMILYSNAAFNVISDFGEEREAFIARVMSLAEEAADKEAEKLTTDLKKKVEALQKKIKQEERQRSLNEMEHEERRRDELLSAGETIVGLVFGSKRSAGLSKAATKRRMTKRYKMKVEDSDDVLADLREELKTLTESAEDEVFRITEEKKEQARVIEEMEVKLEKNDIYMKDFGVLWVPM